jgi:ATP-dependent Clp protease ATP-binding subunit ClpC
MTRRADIPEWVEALIALAVAEARDAHADRVEPMHLLIALCKREAGTIAEVFAAESVSLTGLRQRVRALAHEPGQGTRDHAASGPLRIAPGVIRILEDAREIASQLGRPLDAGFVMVALLSQPDPRLKQVIGRERVPVLRIIQRLKAAAASAGSPRGAGSHARPRARPHSKGHTARAPARGKAGARATPPGRPRGASARQSAAVAPVAPASPTPTLDAYGKDYTALARAGRVEPIIGRRAEIEQLIRILLRRRKNNPVLLGDAGVGKSAVVEGLALEIVAAEAPPDIRAFRVVEVLVSSLLAGAAYRGEFEDRLRKIIDEVERDGHTIIVVDELHTLIGAGGARGTGDAANILKPALARDGLRLIGITTDREFRQFIENDRALERRFHPVRVDEPTPETTADILRGVRPAYERHHALEIKDEAIAAAIELSVRYLPDRRLPDKALDLIDQAAVAKRLSTLTPIERDKARATPVVGRDIAEVLSEWTGIPVAQLATNRMQKLDRMDAELRARIIGQDEAVAAVLDAVRAAYAGLARAARPYGVFAFLGPTGVGKTALARALADALFDGHMVRLDMSEYLEEHAASKLIGAPPGYAGHGEGGLLTEAVRRTPYCVVLFDEIEKAHARVLDLFLQIFDEGRLTDSLGRSADFRNTLVVLTSNLGNDAGFDDEDRRSSIRVRELLSSRLRPELVNRITRAIPFRPLGRDHLRAIVDRLLGSLRAQLEDRRVRLEIAADAYDTLIDLGYQPAFGARQMERVVDRHVVQPMARALIDGRFPPGAVASVVATEGGVELK